MDAVLVLAMESLERVLCIYARSMYMLLHNRYPYVRQIIAYSTNCKHMYSQRLKWRRLI